MKRNALHYTAHLPGSKGEQLRELIYKCGGESDAVDVVCIQWKVWRTF